MQVRPSLLAKVGSHWTLKVFHCRESRQIRGSCSSELRVQILLSLSEFLHHARGAYAYSNSIHWRPHLLLALRFFSKFAVSGVEAPPNFQYRSTGSTFDTTTSF